MSSSESLVELYSTQESFGHLRALLDYASNNARNESSIYGAVSFILTLFCTSARVTATKYKNLYLGSIPQKDLKKSTPDKTFRVPDFTVLIVQSISGQQSTDRKIGNVGPLIWEVKANTKLDLFPWFGEGSSEQPDLFQQFFKYFKQVAAQVVYAKAKFDQKPIYALISIDVWFILLHFPGDAPPMEFTSRKVDPATHLMFNNYMVIPPARIVNENCTAFSPEFLYALQLSVKDLTDLTVIPHPSFRAPEGTAERVSEQLRVQQLSERLKELARHAEIDNRFALGEEDSDERSAGWSVTETDVDDQEYRARGPRNLKKNPPQTRLQTTARRLGVAVKEPTQPGTSNGENIATPPGTGEVPVVDSKLVRRSKRLQRRKVEMPGNSDKKDGDQSGKTA